MNLKIHICGDKNRQSNTYTWISRKSKPNSDSGPDSDKHDKRRKWVLVCWRGMCSELKLHVWFFYECAYLSANCFHKVKFILKTKHCFLKIHPLLSQCKQKLHIFSLILLIYLHHHWFICSCKHIFMLSELVSIN